MLHVRRRLMGLGLVLTLLSGIFGSASAHNDGGKWRKRTVLYYCDYTRFTEAVSEAINQWAAKRGDWPGFVEDCDDPEIWVTEAYSNDEHWFGLGYPQPEGGNYQSGSIVLNVKGVERRQGQERVGGVVHEIGHVFGLQHNCGISVMAGGWPCPLRFTVIKNHDINDLNEIY